MHDQALERRNYTMIHITGFIGGNVGIKILKFGNMKGGLGTLL